MGELFLWNDIYYGYVDCRVRVGGSLPLPSAGRAHGRARLPPILAAKRPRSWARQIQAVLPSEGRQFRITTESY